MKIDCDVSGRMTAAAGRARRHHRETGQSARSQRLLRCFTIHFSEGNSDDHQQPRVRAENCARLSLRRTR
jgi:hypothetical protein